MADYIKNIIVCKKEIGDKVLTVNDNEFEFDFNALIPMPLELDITSGPSHERNALKLFCIDNEDKIDEIKEVLDKAQHFSDRASYWVWNDLGAKPSSDELKELKEWSESYKPKEETDVKNGGINSFLKLGERYFNNIKNYGHPSWLSWRVVNWGCKWPALDTEVMYDEDKDEYTIKFDTAYTMPRNILNKFCELCKPGELNWTYYPDFEKKVATRMTNPNGRINSETVPLAEVKKGRRV